ncbi:MAG TPA: hypothetical protein DCS59_03130 [Eubacterium sp.]|nr:hypothetical protein [Eubacterium sp.]HBI64366.1 hypothetical protein [Clostridiales bacterium]
MKAVVNRIENGIAVVETACGMRTAAAIHGLRDGDIVEWKNGAIVSIDRAATKARRARMQARLDRMLGRSQKNK